MPLSLLLTLFVMCGIATAIIDTNSRHFLISDSALQQEETHNADLDLDPSPTSSMLEKENRKRPRQTECDEWDYRNSVLKLVQEAPFAGLFRDVKNMTKFEASGVAAVRGEFFVVFDSAMSLGLVTDSFSFRGKHHRLIGDPGPESQFEGIAYVPENDTFLLLHEALPPQNWVRDGKGKQENRRSFDPYKPWITTAKINKDKTNYTVEALCAVDFELTHENKGFESILYLHTLNDDGPYLLGLCEGNYCVGGSKGREKGNGRVVVSKLEWSEDGGCLWVPVKTINIPPSAFFQDYSAMALDHATGKIAVLSQEDAAVWISDFDIDAVEFASQEGVVYHMPRDNHCEMVYCNVEGVQWLDSYRLLITSDRAKSFQPFWCSAHDQSIHIMALPTGWKPYNKIEDTVAASRAAKVAAEGMDV